MRNRPSTHAPGASRAAHSTRSGSRRPAPSPPRTKSHAAIALTGSPAPSDAEARTWILAAIGLVALLLVGLGAMILGPHDVGDYFTETDFYGAYAEGARLVQHGQLVPSRYTVVGPGYDVALALVGFVIRDLFLAAEVLSALSTAAIALLWFELLRRRLNARYAIAATAFIVTNGFLFRFGYSATTDTFAIALESAALFALLAPARAAPTPPAAGPDAIAAERTLPWRPAIAGLLMGFAFLTRYNAIALFPAGIVAIAARWTPWPRRRTALVALVAGFLAPVLPWIAYSLAHGGTLALQLHHNIAYEVFARSRGIAWDDYQKTMQREFPNLISVIARDPAAVLTRMVANVGEHLRSDASSLLRWPIAVAGVIGLVLSVRDGTLRRLAPMLVTGVLLFLTLVPVFYSERYSLALLPVYATMAGAAFASPIAALAVGRRRVWLKPVLAVLAVSFALPAAARQQAWVMSQLPHEVRSIGRTLRGLRRPGDRVIARKSHIAYYGDCTPEPFPFADSLPALAAAARATRTRWLYFSWPEAETRPRFWYLLDTSATVPGLTAVRASRNRPAVLYEIGPDFGRTPDWVRNDTLRTYHVLRAQTFVDSVHAEIWRRYGYVAWWLRRYPEARDALEHAAHLAPVGDVYATLGRVYVALGDHQHAYDAFGRAYDLLPRDPDTRVAYGFSAYLLGREREAADLWRPAIDLTVDPHVLQAMATVYARLGDAQALAAVRARLASAVRS